MARGQRRGSGPKGGGLLDRFRGEEVLAAAGFRAAGLEGGVADGAALKMSLGKGAPGVGFQVFLEGYRFGLFREGDRNRDSPRAKSRRVADFAVIVLFQTGAKIVGSSDVAMIPTFADQEVNEEKLTKQAFGAPGSPVNILYRHGEKLAALSLTFGLTLACPRKRWLDRKGPCGLLACPVSLVVNWGPASPEGYAGTAFVR